MRGRAPGCTALTNTLAKCALPWTGLSLLMRVVEVLGEMELFMINLLPRGGS